MIILRTVDKLLAKIANIIDFICKVNPVVSQKERVSSQSV